MIWEGLLCAKAAMVLFFNQLDGLGGENDRILNVELPKRSAQLSLNLEIMKDQYPYYLANEAFQPNRDLKVTDSSSCLVRFNPTLVL